jgi:hypothetical protein
MRRILFVSLLTLGISAGMQAQSESISDGKKAIAEKMKELAANRKEKVLLEKGSKEYNICYDKLKELEIKKNNSESKQEANRLRDVFSLKLNQKTDTTIFTKKEVFFPWIEENINSALFVNVDAAKEEWLRLNDANEKSMNENSDYYVYMIELNQTVKNFVELSSDVKSVVYFEGRE